MRLFLVVFLVVFSIPAFSSTGGNAFGGLVDFMSNITGYLDDTWSFFTVEMPSWWERFFAWLLEWYLMMSLYIKIEFVKISYIVAQSLIEQLSIAPLINTALASLDNDVRSTLIEIRFFDGLMLMIEAGITRLVMDSV